MIYAHSFIGKSTIPIMPIEHIHHHYHHKSRKDSAITKKDVEESRHDKIKKPDYEKHLKKMKERKEK